jgi:hypothetical protein
MVAWILGIRGRQWGMAGLLFVASYVTNGATTGIMMPPRTDASPAASLASTDDMPDHEEHAITLAPLLSEMADASTASASLRN